MKVGQRICLKPGDEEHRLYGTIIFVHPEHSFVVVEYPVLYGHKLRTTLYFGRRRGRQS